MTFLHWQREKNKWHMYRLYLIVVGEDDEQLVIAKK
jgi:hypothetical protein